MLVRLLLTGIPMLIIALIYMGDKEEVKNQLANMGCVLPAVLNIGTWLFCLCAFFLFSGMAAGDTLLCIIVCVTYPAILVIWAIKVRVDRATWRKLDKLRQQSVSSEKNEKENRDNAPKVYGSEYTEDEFKKLPAWKRIELMQQCDCSEQN